MELCKEVQAEEYVVQVVEATNFYTYLRFSLLASTWIPRPVGVCLWSALHVILVVYVPLMFLTLYTPLAVLAVCLDALIFCGMLYMLLIFPIIILFYFLGVGLGVALIWIWLVITCHCCTMPGRAPGQSLGQYILTGGRTINRNPEPQAAAAVEGGAAGPGPWAFLTGYSQNGLTPGLFRHVKVESFPYWRVNLVNFSREVLPLYDTIVI